MHEIEPALLNYKIAAYIFITASIKYQASSMKCNTRL